ncbi:hypothetical protein GE09DRAFT_1106365 [Coniochaeta sp. 2T2.1]|nr:hypothetical protein GE09DRAFT_1106365 [Coniochaeta sp. 2T2.1]
MRFQSIPTLLMGLASATLAVNFAFSYLDLDTNTPLNLSVPEVVNGSGVRLAWEYHEDNNASSTSSKKPVTWAPDNTYTNITFWIEADNDKFKSQKVYNGSLVPGESSIDWKPDAGLMKENGTLGGTLPVGKVLYYKAEMYNYEDDSVGVFVRSDKFSVAFGVAFASEGGLLRPGMGVVVVGSLVAVCVWGLL